MIEVIFEIFYNDKMTGVTDKALKRVALIQPPRKGAFFLSELPLGLVALASSIKEDGYEPIFIDLYLFSVLNRDLSDFFQQMAEEILRHKPDILGFSVMCNTLPVALLIAEECKKLAPQIPIIFGGPEASFNEVELLEAFRQVDIVVRGEGEITLKEVLQALENKRPLANVLGITFRENNHVVKNQDRPYIKDLDQLPFFDFSLLPHLKMYKGGIEAGRGCPFSCTFCSTCRMWQRRFRIKSPQRIVKEMKQVSRIFKNSFVAVSHDHLLASRKFADEFLFLLAKEELGWESFSRLDALDEDLIKKLKQSGCRHLYLGIETGSVEMQKEIKKKVPLEKLPQVLKLLSQNEIKTTVSFILGFPNETESQINQTLLLALNSKLQYPFVEIQLFLFTFLKGSDLYAKVKDKFSRYEFQETPYSSLATDSSAELDLIKKYPHIFPSFHYIGNQGIQPKILQKLTFLFLFLTRSYTSPILSLLQHLSVSPFQLGQKIISFFDAEGVDWSPSRGFHFPQFIVPFKKFIREYANPLYKEFFWWDEAFEKWNKKKKC